MNKQKSKTQKTKKRISTIIAILMILALLLTGTYAWVDYSQHRTNEFDNTNSKTYDIYLVEDFAPIHNWTTSDAPKLKNISVMNKGEAPEFGAGYVRLSLKEYFEFSEKTYTYSDNWYALNNNGDYIYIDKDMSKADAILEAEAMGYYNGVGYETDYTSGVEGWFAIAGADHINGQYGKHMITGIDNSTPDSLAPGIERAEYEETENHKLSPTGECAYTPHDWTGADQFGFRDYVKWNLGPNVISLTEWAAKSETAKDDFFGWIYDDRTTSGYVYWSQPLEPKAVTTKLLETVELINQPSGDFYYALHVDMETLSLDELAKEVYEWQDAPEKVIEYWLKRQRPSVPETTEESDVSAEFVSIETAYNFTIGLKSNGTVWAWGANNDGQLGNNLTDDSYVPVQVLGENGEGFLLDIIAIEAGRDHCLALKSDGTVWTWGANYDGQLGNNSTVDSYVPIQVSGENGEEVLKDVKTIVSNYNLNLAVKENGTIWAWGANDDGQLGNNSTVDSYVPVQVLGENGIGYLNDVIDLAVSSYGDHVLALKSNGTVWAWGNNYKGQLGNNTTDISLVPVQVVEENGVGFLENIISVSAGCSNSFAIKSNGTVWAWGSNINKVIGKEISEFDAYCTPQQVLGINNVKSISASYLHVVALKNDGTVWTWGYNGSGCLGIGVSYDWHAPVQVLGENGNGFLTHAERIASVNIFNGSTFVYKEDGTIWAWGDNSSGQLGDGTTTTRSTPVQVLLP